MATDEQITQVLVEDAKRAPDLIIRLTEMFLEQQHRLTVLAAGVLGVVIPILANSKISTAPWRLHRAIYWSAASIVLGVLVSAVARGSLTYQLRQVHEALKERSYRVGFAQGSGAGPMAVAEALQSLALSAEKQKQWRWFTVVWWALELGQVLAFLVAAILIATAF